MLTKDDKKGKYAFVEHVSVPEGKEIKTVLGPKEFTKLIFRAMGGKLLVTQHPIDGLHTMEFSTGDAGKAEKLNASNEGIVIVQRGIVTTVRDDVQKVLVSNRLSPPHIVTGGGSILVSGDAESDPHMILRHKLVLPEELEGESEMVGYGLSSLEQTKGIQYLFEIHRMRLRTMVHISAKPGKDPVSFQPIPVAQHLIAGKKLEEQVLTFAE